MICTLIIVAMIIYRIYSYNRSISKNFSKNLFHNQYQMKYIIYTKQVIIQQFKTSWKILLKYFIIIIDKN